jgi:hypothetical protein
MKLLPGESFLMPDQDKPFNGDMFLCDKFLELKEKFNINCAIELGSCVGGTTKWLSENFDFVYAIEINKEYLNIGKQRASANNIRYCFGSTIEMLPEVLCQINNYCIFHIDSHWGPNNPLLKELELISDYGLKPVLEIHDFKVPGHPELGFDSYGGQDYEWNWIKESIEKIYGIDGYEIEYNSKATGAKRGVIFITPKTQLI